MAAPTVLAFSLGLLVAPAQDSQAIAAAACLMSAWNDHDVAAARKCYVAAPVTVRGATRAQVDWGTEAGYRGFDGATHAVFRYEVVAVTGKSVEIALHERTSRSTFQRPASSSCSRRYPAGVM